MPKEPHPDEIYWERTHADGYQDVYSITEDSGLRTRIINALLTGPHKKILVPGCGSRGLLERDMADRLPHAQKITCTDFKNVVSLPAAANKDIKKINYAGQDSRILHQRWKNHFDAVVIVNSVLSPDHQENKDILTSCLQALKPGGKFIGLFPTVFCALDISYATHTPEWRDTLDLEQNTFHDPVQGVKQTFYSPLRLRQIFNATGYNLDQVEICYLDSPHFKEESERLYGLRPEQDVVLYEHLVLAHRPG